MYVADNIREPLFEYLLRLGDDRLILGHRLSEWCGHGPILEEDIALANIALDCIGQANALLGLAAEVESKGRSADDLAYFREAIDFKNVQMVEQPRGDFAFTIARQFAFDIYALLLYTELCQSSFEPLAAIATKALKEVTYHTRHSSEWMLRLGDGTEESHEKIQHALNDIWMYTAELFESDETIIELQEAGIVSDYQALKNEWLKRVSAIVKRATLKMPDPNQYMVSGSRHGKHSEHLGYLLGELQILQRSYPGCEW